ncbi:insulin-like receptor isoform X2 [Eupeodes corollae]|uniref:insulin-like receptor isoform X2 n=1 Tax=Eupeodes corollae TaxID=290404 RepID=UPI0024929F0E|nr:insulin-like receptor isoform X2 [Eupeodes corollae]
MDISNCTTMLNRTNYCSILKKRKSSCKESTITVKLKRYTLKEEKSIQTMNTNKEMVDDDIKNKNNTMCLICRIENECPNSDNLICNSMATLNRQHQTWKHDNDNNSSRKSQNFKNYVAMKTSSTSSIPSDTSPSPLSSSSSSPTTKWNVLEIANQKSQSQRHAASVSCCWNDSCSSFSDSSSMPSCQLQSTSFSSTSISPPILSKAPSSSTSNKTKTSLLSSSPQQQQLSPAACSASSSETEAEAAATSTIEISSSASSSSSTTTTTTTKTTTTISATEATASSRLSSSRTNTLTTPLSLTLPLPLPLTLPSCINSSTSLSGNSKSCASLLRTLALVAVILEKCFIGMFGTRHIGMPFEHNNNNSNYQMPVSIQKSKRKSHISSSGSGSTKSPIMFMFLSLSFMMMMLPTTTNAAGTEVALEGNEKVCKSRDIRNSVSEFYRLENCTVIEGFLLISLIEGHNHSAYEKYSFPLLTEVTEFVMIYRVNGLRTLSTLFPNLSIIRGKELFEGFALILYENTHLEDVGLVSLTTIARGAIRMEKNPALCFVETIDWTRITVNMTNDQNFFWGNKAVQECPGCPGEVDENSDKDCNGKCWNSVTCQKICPNECKNNCNDKLQCCHESCIGGCSNNDFTKCKGCRQFTKMKTCIDKCPKDFFTYLERRCVTAETCKEIGTKLEGSKPAKLVPFNGVCSVRCPPGHTKNDTTLTCQKCDGKCVKSCDGGLIDSVAAAKAMHGCTRIVNSGLSISIKRGGRHLMEELEMGLSSIEEIDTYLKVHRTYGVTSLAFFKNLKRIKGTILESDKFALYILENQDLERIWAKDQVQMDAGRVFFHFNPKLCYSEIEKLRSSLKNPIPFDKNEVATDSNGSKGSCNTEVLNVEVVKVSSASAHVRVINPMKFEDDRVLIGYQFFYTADPYKNVSIFGQRPCDDSWESNDPSRDTDHIFVSLKPFTQYAFYVKTQTISSEPRNGQSPIVYFRTKPDQPKTVQNLNAHANSSSEIIIRWSRPQVTNGNLTKYIINVTLDANYHQKSKSRNYCKEPIKKAASDEVGLPFTNEKADPGLISTNGGTNANCKCEKNVTRKDGVNPQVVEAIYENVIEFENNVQNFVYVKQTNDSQSDNSRQRRRRALENLGDMIITSTTQTPFSKTKTNSQLYRVNASVTEFVLRNLTHFSLYTIKVQACRAQEIGESAKDCSPESIAYSRTHKLPNVDLVRNVQLELDSSNTTRKNIRIRWDPPEQPNSLIVSYTIIYFAVDSEDAVIEKRCISPLDTINFTNSYVIYGLPTGNYSIVVQANSLAGEGIESQPAYIYIPPNRITWQTITIICVCVFVFLCTVAFTVYYVRKKFLAPPSDLKIFPTVNPYYISMQYLPDEWEVPRDKIIQLGALGQGSFGMVYEGILKNFNSQEDTPCAIKTVNENATDRERLNFLKEASVMKQFNTHHVVRLLGVCSRGQPALVIMELMKNGDLKAYLRQHRPDAEQNHGEPVIRPPTLDRIYQIAIEIADGMAYLAAKKYVHRDLAARNCMVAADLTVKIGDFGMTRDVYETDYYRKGTKGLLPVRWMSPESLKDGIFSSASDVFSYGVVLWEMATLASQPYQGFSNDQVLRFVIDGGVMERPENCPDKLYKVMQKCWQHRPSARPTFMEIIRFLLDSADPKFQEVSFYHSAEAKDMHDQMVPEHDMDDVTTPLRVGEFDYKLNIDDNSSVEPHESPALDEEDEDDDNIQSHSPYSLGSAIIINSTPGNHSKFSPRIIMNQSNPSLSLPSTSAAAAKTASIASVSGKQENAEYVQPDTSYDNNENDQHQNNTSDDSNANSTATAQKPIKYHPSSKYPSSLKRAVASTVQNVSNSLVPLNFLQRRLFKNNNSKPSGQQHNKSAKSESSNNNGNNNNSKKSSISPNVELGAAGSRSFFAGLTPSHTSKNPNYQILDESLNVSVRQNEQSDAHPPTSSRSRTESCSSAASGSSNRNQGNNTMQPRQQQQQHKTTEQCNLNKDNTNYLLSTSSSNCVSNPISLKDNKNTNSEASSAVIPTSNTSNTPTSTKTKTPYQLKEKWLQQQLPSKAVPPNGFIGREG